MTFVGPLLRLSVASQFFVFTDSKTSFKSTDLSIVVSGLITPYALTYDASDVFVSILRF